MFKSLSNDKYQVAGWSEDTVFLINILDFTTQHTWELQNMAKYRSRIFIIQEQILIGTLIV